MKPLRSALLAANLALFLNIVGAAGQGTFQNLDFESANLAGYPPPILGHAATSVPISDGLPNWSAYFSSVSQGRFQMNSVWYDGLSLGGAAISVVDSKWPGGESPSLTPIQGNYSILLCGGGLFNDTSSIISQTGLVPAGAMSLQVEMSWFAAAPVITLGGQTLSMVPLRTFPSYTLYEGYISSFAGQVATLSITEPPYGQVPPSYVFLDDIRFVIVPEPSAFALFALAAFLIGRRLHLKEPAWS